MSALVVYSVLFTELKALILKVRVKKEKMSVLKFRY